MCTKRRENIFFLFLSLSRSLSLSLRCVMLVVFFSVLFYDAENFIKFFQVYFYIFLGRKKKNTDREIYSFYFLVNK